MKKKTLVFGASMKPERISNMAVGRLVKKNIPVVAFGLKQGEINGVTIDTELIDYKDVHTITLYINSKRQKAYYDYLIGLQPTRVIFNPGTENLEFYQMLKDRNIAAEMSCTLVLLSTDQY